MAAVKHNVSLRPYNTFAIDVRARAFATFESTADINALIGGAHLEPWVLGGGSNILLTKDVDRLVLHNCIPGVSTVDRSGSNVLISIGGGVVWHDLVTWAVESGYGGIENLALIPGRTGAAPIQNIGAYGVELADVFDHLEALDLQTGRVEEFDRAACQFGYRDSFFKREGKGRYCITRVFLRLRAGQHHLNTSYGAIASTLQSSHITKPGIRDVYDAVISIRSSKLPDPSVLPNSGSFFKNPVVSREQADALLLTFPNLVTYLAPGNSVKIPAGWLIEQCGWKGKRVGNVGCYERQALVMVNYGGASGAEVYEHAARVMESVRERFGIDLVPEVNVI